MMSLSFKATHFRFLSQSTSPPRPHPYRRPPLHKTSPGWWWWWCFFRHQTNIAAAIPQQQDKSLHVINHLYSNLLGICREHSKHVQSRKLFDEIPERPIIAALKAGRIVHAKSVKLGFRLNGHLGNAILDLYAKCGHVSFALEAFHELEIRDLQAWNSVLAMFSRLGRLEQVLGHFGSMRGVVMPDQFTFAFVSSACAGLKDVEYGKQVHCNVLKLGLASSSFCEGSLIDMYAKCGRLTDARQILDASEALDNVSWTAMISGYVRVGFLEESLKLFECMQKKRGLVPDHVVFVTVMNACITLGKLDDAYQMFAKMNNPNVVAWNVLISGNTKRGLESEAVKIFQDMRKADVRSTRSTLGSILSSIASLENIDLGLQVHSHAIKEGLAFNIYVGSSLINMYSKCRKMEDAKKVFDLLDEKKKNVVLWNAILAGFAQNEYSVEVIELFLEMRNSGGFHAADDFTFTSVLSACGSLENLELGRQLHACTVKKNLAAANLFVGNALVDMYGKCRNLTEARRQFELIPDRDNVSWNAIIVGYVQEEEAAEAFKLFRRMRLEGIAPDEVSLTGIANACANLQAINTGKQVHCLSVKLGLENGLYCGSSLIDMYCKCGAMEDAYGILNRMPKLNVPAINALIGGYSKSLDLEKAVNLLYVMRDEGLKPSEITYACLVDSIDGGPSSLHFGKQMHCVILKAGFLSDADYIGVSLVSMYLNCGEFLDARNAFLGFPNPKSLVLWTCVISGHAQNNCCEVAIELYHRMRNWNVMPDQATFASVLKACSSLAVLRGGEEIHSIVFHTGFDSDTLIASALIDMYAKCGELRSSMQVFAEMETKTSVVQWNSMIVGFAKNGYADDAFRLFGEMREANVEPDEVTFLGILTACSHTGRVSEGREVFEIMTKQYGMRPSSEHCACMIDILGRSGNLDEALELIENLEFAPGVMMWSSFLAACRMHGDDARGKVAAEKLIELEPGSSSPYVLKSHLYAASENWEGVNSIRKRMREKGASKFPGYSRVSSKF
ncbi:pentatricopeptide repeat-containing protein At3g09040, mitochondrial [Impatiens glandulifera]|uniref:pentatricopeptide repeat-containing protein At3g09040, mitochondrial n=1 Tax=Impatiens glandulifera TaxID=253017 RepID=UPI001FB08790|nr:pentatricopeptide repeat-containing protein At3g09040, mitochondrial [Impatiens glandulifera]